MESNNMELRTTEVPTRSKLEQRVYRAADAALARQHYVSAIDVLCGMGLLASSAVDLWRKGRIDFLERQIQGSPSKISSSMAIFRQWALEKNLKPSETDYVRAARSGTVPLQFSESGDPQIEKNYRTHYLSPALTERKQQKLQERLDKAPLPVVFLNLRDAQCAECGAEIAQGSMLLMEAEQPLCLPCAHLGGLEFVPSGDAALTRRATKYSKRSAIVVRFNRPRKRYERQGILVEDAALEKAEQECVQDAGERAAARARAAVQRCEQDRKLVAQMIQLIAELFPGCPAGEVAAIAEHTAVRGSGRVGRSEAGRNLDEKALILAVGAAVRHNHTPYDELLASGVDRAEARLQIAGKVEEMLARWRKADPGLSTKPEPNR
jgi:hypothetical protein